MCVSENARVNLAWAYVYVYVLCEIIRADQQPLTEALTIERRRASAINRAAHSSRASVEAARRPGADCAILCVSVRVCLQTNLRSSSGEKALARRA